MTAPVLKLVPQQYPVKRCGRILKQYNPEQLSAVKHRGRHLVIFAGPGTGKTAVLAHRAASLIAEGVLPYQIALLTFTNKAADTIRYRTCGLVERGDCITSGTFHAVASRLLHRFGHLVGIEDFTVIDRSEAGTLLTYLRKELGLVIPAEIKSRHLLEVMSLADNLMQPLEQVLASRSKYKDCAGAVLRLQMEYAAYKRAHDQLDYDDLLFGLLDLAEQRSDVLYFKHILVDEAQDMSLLQVSLLHALLKGGAVLAAVGDPDQSIYGFRGAAPSVMEDLVQSAAADVLHLSRNYRSGQPVLDFAHTLISQVPGRRSLLISGKTGPSVICKVFPSDAEEARQIAASLYKAGCERGRYDDIAVLYSSSQHGVRLQAELSALGIPYYTCGGLKVSDTAHIKDMFALLRLSVSSDTLSLRRILQLIPGIGEAKAVRIADEGLDSSAVPSKAAERVAALAACLEAMRGSQPGYAWTTAFAWYSSLVVQPHKIHDIEQMGAVAAESSSVRHFLDSVALDSVREKEEKGVCLSTVHSAKGREFSQVYVLGVSDGLFASAKPGTSSYAESVRLLYVACTRAKQTLRLSCPLICRMPDNSLRQTTPLPHIAFALQDVR